MEQSNIKPDKINSPIQLMAAWFVMLILLSGVLLTAATQIHKPEWVAGYLVIFSSLMIIIVIASVLLMLTKYRPHLQDGKEYAEWIKDKGIYSNGYFKNINISSTSNTSMSSNNIATTEISKINNILVSVINVDGSQHIIEMLKNEGYNAELFENDNKNKKTIDMIKNHNEGIWIGSRISPDLAINAIKLAIKIWPELKYISISSDQGSPPDYIHDQIFIGGSTSSALRNNLNKWNNNEINELDTNLSIQDFHSKIRTKYS